MTSTRLTANDLCITHAHVKAALHALLYNVRGHRMNPLENTALVAQEVATYNFLPSAETRAFALGNVLTTLIQEQLRWQRCALGIYDFAEQSVVDVREAVVSAARKSSRELLTWTWLYYRYVRIEFEISPQDFCAWAYLNPRTLRRYQEHGIRRITEELILREQTLRQPGSGFSPQTTEPQNPTLNVDPPSL